MPIDKTRPRSLTPPVKSNNNSTTQPGNPNVKTDSAVFATTPANEPESQNQPLNLFYENQQEAHQENPHGDIPVFYGTDLEKHIVIGAHRFNKETLASPERRKTISGGANVDSKKNNSTPNKWLKNQPISVAIPKTPIKSADGKALTLGSKINNNNELLTDKSTQRLSQIIPTKAPLPRFCTLENGTLKVTGIMNPEGSKALSSYLKAHGDQVKCLDLSRVLGLSNIDDDNKFTRLHNLFTLLNYKQSITELNLAGSDFKAFLLIHNRIQKQHTKNEKDGAPFNNPLQFKYITKFNISDCQLDAQDVNYLFSGPSSLEKVVELDISNNNIGPDGTRLIRINMPQLKNLNMSRNKLGDEGARELSGCDLKGGIAKETLNLEVLDISDNNIGSGGTQYTCKGILNLKKLNISLNPIGIEGIKEISIYIANSFKKFNLEGIAEEFSELNIAETNIGENQSSSYTTYINSILECKVNIIGLKIQDLTN